jgi:putative acetyltransferase
MQAAISLADISIRTIQPADNPALAKIIRSALEEFGANHPGTVYYDDTTDALYELFSSTPGSVYFVAVHQNEVIGGGGIFPSAGLPSDTCELVKMYLKPDVRNIGLGRTIIQKAIDTAVEMGYRNMYLETMPELKPALKAYERFGFQYLSAPMGNTGHFGCDRWMIKRL